ncbi:MAG: hypothetical protein QNL04_05720 [SAR324 cluster bacterium]|nr:hypothetical protein [SAR324 cluster bacterium]
MTPGIEHLNQTEKEWLYLVIWKLIISDGWVSPEESTIFIDALNWVTKDEMTAIEEKAGSIGDEIPIEPLADLDHKKAGTMLCEIIRIAAIDGVLALGEVKIIEQAAKLLHFDTETELNALKLAQQYANLNKERMHFVRDLKKHFTK